MKSIIFDGESVRAILDGRKTQTRRVIKPVGRDEGFVCVGQGDGSFWPYRSYDGEALDDGRGCEVQIPCPYRLGDLVYVKETWAAAGKHTDTYTTTDICVNRAHFEIFRKADCYYPDGAEKFNTDFLGRWRSPIGMPRWASRITLKITDVRVQRLQEIDEKDAAAEGFPPLYFEHIEEDGHASEKWEFNAGIIRHWNETNKRHPWESNPWVWVISFERAEGEKE